MAKSKKFVAPLIAVLFSICFLYPALTSAAESTIPNLDEAGISAGLKVEDFYNSLPKAKGNYKSRVRPILIEGAMNIETEMLVRALKNPVVYKELNYLFFAGTYKNYPVVVVRTEQGMANSAASTALAIKIFNPIAVISQGTAGGHDPKLKINDIVIAECAIDYSAIKTADTPKGAGADITNQEMRGTFAYDKATGTFQLHEEYRPDPTLLKIAKSVADSHREFNVVTGTISTADAWISNYDYTLFLHKKYGSSCEEMETSCVAQICQNADLPFIGIRALSDSIFTDEEYNPNVAVTAQNFVLLVVEKYISDVLKS